MYWVLLSTANAAMLASAVLTWAVRRVARARGWTAGPRSRRHIHTLPLPRLGGIAIFSSFLLVGAIVQPKHPLGLLMAVPAALMFGVGIADDVWGVRASRKLLGQIIAAVVLFVIGFRIPIPGPYVYLGMTLSFCLTALWSVVVMNAVNLVDGLDGLAGGATTCAIGAMLVAALRFQQPETALVAAILLGAVLGFLRFNLHPATIFLGDSGSLVIGVLTAAISIRLMQASPWGILVSVLALAHPLGEVSLSTIRRAITAHSVFLPDRRHFHHRLLDRNITHRRSTQALVAISLVFGLLAVLVARGGISAAIALALGGILAVYIFRAFRYREFKYLANLKRKILNHRFAIDAHVQLHDVSSKLEATCSLGELQNLVHQLFTAIGFSRAELRISELKGNRPASAAADGMEISFPISARRGHLGSLVLHWELSAAPPLDFDVFQEEFLPVLARTVNAHLLRHRELEVSLPAPKSRPKIVPSKGERGRKPSLVPLN